VTDVTHEMLGSVIEAIKRAGKSLAIVEGVRNPVKGYYTSLIEHKILPGPNPAADLRYFIGRHAHRKHRTERPAYFTREEAPQLVATAAALFPRWSAFILIRRVEVAVGVGERALLSLGGVTPCTVLSRIYAACLAD